MKRITCYTLIFCLLSVPLAAQEDDSGRDSYLFAENAYRDGQFEKAIRLLEQDMMSYDVLFIPDACRLLALCYMAIDRTEKAEENVKRLLRYSPYYTVSMQDPPRFADLVRRYREGRRTLVTASQQVETQEEAPVPVTLVTEEMIKAIGARTLNDVLIAYVPGMTLVESNEEMNVAMRGIYSSGQEKILLMLNGHRLNSYSTNTACPDFSIALEKVKQIEVLRGPASSLYGGVALTAVINIITKSGSELNGAKLNMGAGSYGQLKGDFLFGKHFVDWDIAGWASIYHSAGEEVTIPIEVPRGIFFMPVSDKIIIGGYNRKPSYDIGLDLRWNALRLLYNTNFRKSVAPYSMSYYFAPYSYERYRTFKGNLPGFANTSHHLEASVEKHWNRFQIKAAINVDAADQIRYQVAGDAIPESEYNLLFPVGTKDTIVALCGAFQYHNWQEMNYGASLQGSFTYKWGDRNVGTINGGVQWSRFHLNDSYYVEGDHYDRVLVTYNNSKNLHKGYETSADGYLQIKHRWRDLFILNLGMRCDYKKRSNKQVIKELSPRVALILLRPKWNLKLSYAKSFVDAPYFYRNNTLDTTTGGESLLSEYLHSWQLTFIGNLFSPRIEFDVNLFYNRATDFIVPDGMVYTNAGKLENVGLELTAAYTHKKLTGRFNLTWQHVLSFDKYNVKGSSVYNVPSVTANLIASYELFKGFRGNSFLNILSGQSSAYEKLISSDNIELHDIDIPARAIWNGSLSYQWRKSEVNFQISNILNKTYQQGGTSIGPIRQQGRWYMFGISYKF